MASRLRVNVRVKGICTFDRGCERRLSTSRVDHVLSVLKMVLRFGEACAAVGLCSMVGGFAVSAVLIKESTRSTGLMLETQTHDIQTCGVNS